MNAVILLAAPIVCVAQENNINKLDITQWTSNTADLTYEGIDSIVRKYHFSKQPSTFTFEKHKPLPLMSDTWNFPHEDLSVISVM